MRRANPYRSAIRRILRDEQRARPGCALISTIGVDEDSRAYIHFSCLSHEATWRYYIHVNVDTELAAQAYPGSELSSRCPRGNQDGVPRWTPVPEMDSSAQAPQDPLGQSDELIEEVEDEVS